jgi:4-hydroxy-tetrahydrodipicolinate synthase
MTKEMNSDSKESLGKKLGHILIPLATPFKDDEYQDVDYDAVGPLVNHVIENKLCDSLVVAGTSGEFNAMTVEERFELFKAVKEAAAGRVPLVAGACAGSTRDAILLAKKAEELEFDAIMVVGPYYCRTTQEGIYQHFASVAKATTLPVMLYNIPIFTGTNVEKETVARLAKDFSNVVGIKDEAGINPTQMTEFARVTPEGFTIYNGDDIMVLCGMIQGAAGVVSGASHVVGHKIREMIESFLAGDLLGARKIHMELDPFFKAFGSNDRINGIPLWKAALNLCGLKVGPPRLPLVRATDEEIEIMRSHLVRMGILEQ